MKEKLDYMHRNPVQRKLVRDPRDWPWSSWSYYENGEHGLIRIDTLMEERVQDRTATAGKVKTRTLEHHKGAAPNFVLLAASSPPAF